MEKDHVVLTLDTYEAYRSIKLKQEQEIQETKEQCELEINHIEKKHKAELELAEKQKQDIQNLFVELILQVRIRMKDGLLQDFANRHDLTIKYNSSDGKEKFIIGSGKTVYHFIAA